MDTKLLEEILSCPALPSLPTVAVRVLELTSDPEVQMDQLAQEIQYDQGIAAKILRTVNSSFFGLRRRCSSIDHALVMLGLGPVKSLVLGFSLVSTVKAQPEGEDGEVDDFDYPGYWKRCLLSAVAAKYAAETSGNKLIVDEAFLSGLFQDIGMVAMHRTIGDRYSQLIKDTEGDHSKLAKLELDNFGEIQHSMVGAMICENWKLPNEIVLPVRYHDKATACPQEFAQIARCVALGNQVHAVMEQEENPTEALRRVYSKGASWLGFTEAQIDDIIRKTGETAKEIGSLFTLDVGAVADADEVLQRADRQLIELSKNQEIEGYAAKQFADLLVDSDSVDPFTGTLLREGFNVAVRQAFDSAHAGEYSLSVVQVMISGYEDLAEKHGENAQDEVLIATAVLLRRQFEHMGGVICRLSDSVFAAVLPGVERLTAAQQANLCCEEFTQRAPSWVPDAEGIEQSVKLSMGVATLDDTTRPMISKPELLVQAASQALVAAKSGEGSLVRAFVPRKAAA